MSRMLTGGVLALFASVAVGHAIVETEGKLEDGRDYVVIKPGTGPCPKGFKRSYSEIVPGSKEDDPAMLGPIMGSWDGGCIKKRA